MQIIKINNNNRYFRESVKLLYEWWKDIKHISYDEVYTQLLDDLKEDSLPNLYALVINDTLIAIYEINEKDDVDEAPYTPYIASIFVKEEFRGNGYMKMIMSDAFSKIKGMGYDKAYLHSSHEGLYEKFGFTHIDDVDTKYGKKRIFEKEL